MDIFYFAAIENALTAGRVWSGKLKARTKDGRELELEATYSPVFDADATSATALRSSATSPTA